MTLDEATKIVQIWGKYVEYVDGKIRFLFCGYIPESFLPVPKTILEEAVNILAEHYYNNGNQDAISVLQSTIPLLISYVDDEKAVLKAAEIYNNPSWRETMLPGFKKFQETWIKTKGALKTK